MANEFAPNDNVSNAPAIAVLLMVSPKNIGITENF
jgi:hypothetical protein